MKIFHQAKPQAAGNLAVFKALRHSMGEIFTFKTVLSLSWVSLLLETMEEDAD